MSTLSLCRLFSLVIVLLVCDGIFLWFAVTSVVENGLNVVVLFGFEVTCFIIIYYFWIRKRTICKRRHCLFARRFRRCCISHCTSAISDLAFEAPVSSLFGAISLPSKNCFFFFYIYMLLFIVLGFVSCFNMLLYFIFFTVVLVYVGRPLHLIRQMYYSYARFVRRVRAIVKWRRATSNLNERYPVCSGFFFKKNHRDFFFLSWFEIELNWFEWIYVGRNWWRIARIGCRRCVHHLSRNNGTWQVKWLINIFFLFKKIYCRRLPCGHCLHADW